MGFADSLMMSHFISDCLHEDLLRNVLALRLLVVVDETSHTGVVETAELAGQVLLFGMVL